MCVYILFSFFVRKEHELHVHRVLWHRRYAINLTHFDSVNVRPCLTKMFPVKMQTWRSERAGCAAIKKFRKAEQNFTGLHSRYSNLGIKQRK